jgi:hexokinase
MREKIPIALGTLKKDFALTKEGMLSIIKDFHGEMERGLRKRPSSLKMLPTYVDRPSGNERGSYIALDLGGTNFRVLTLKLRGAGRISGLKVMKFAIPKKVMTGDGKELFAFLARSIKKFLSTSAARGLDLGFTFSFPINQRSVASGDLVVWTKGFEARGVVGRDVVVLLKEALRREGLSGIRVAALANDTVGTLVARAYSDLYCDVGVIIGTGTNACYTERSRHMIINIEWGNFNKLRKTRYDKLLDSQTDNPGCQILEKMVSGMYLGEVVRLVLMELARNGAFECGSKFLAAFGKPMSLKSEYVSMTEAEEPSVLTAAAPGDRALIKAVCDIVSVRAARISAAVMAAVVTKMDPMLSKKHTIAVDGSVYEKHTGFSGNIKKGFKKLFGSKASRIKLVLSKDGSGKGAAIIAAVAGAASRGR